MKKSVKWVILFTMFILAIFNYADKSIVGLAVEPMMKDLNLNFEQFGLVGSSFYWLFCIFGIIGGALSDRIGTGKMLIIMAIVWTLSQSMVLFVAGLPLLLLSRVFLGLGEGPFNAVAVSHLNKYFKPEQRGLATSIFMFGNLIGKAVTAPIIIWLILTYSWRTAFVVLGLGSFVWVIAWLFVGRLKPTEPIQDEVAVDKGSKQDVSRKEIWKALTSPITIFTILTAFVGMCTLVFGLTFLPAYFKQIKGLSDTATGSVLAIGTLLGSIMYSILSVISDRMYKKNQDMRKSRILFAAVCVALSSVVYWIFPYAKTVGSLIAIETLTVGLIGAIGVLGPQIVISMLPQRSGLMSGTYFGLYSSAGIFLPIIAGKIIQSAGSNPAAGFNTIIQALGIALLIASILLMVFGKQKQNAAIENDKKLVNI